jgi:hypothetical protein
MPIQVRVRLYLEGKTLEALQAKAGQEYRTLDAQAAVELMRALGTWEQVQQEYVDRLRKLSRDAEQGDESSPL